MEISILDGLRPLNQKIVSLLGEDCDGGEVISDIERMLSDTDTSVRTNGHKMGLSLLKYLEEMVEMLELIDDIF